MITQHGMILKKLHEFHLLKKAQKVISFKELALKGNA